MDRRTPSALVAAIVVVAACAGSTASPSALAQGTAIVAASAAPSSSAAPPSSSAALSLQVATVEPGDSPEGKAIEFFVGEVKRLTGGSLTIVPLTEAGESDQDNITQVTAGTLEMAIVQARNWDEFGVTSMQALQAPFLITTDAMAAAATKGDIADALMSGLDEKGVNGLALWPIDLRHPVSFGKPFLSPADIKGANIRIVGSTITADLVRALGGTPVHSGDVDDSALGGAESAFDRAYSLPRPGTFTGNVTFYPRVDVFVINQDLFAGLSPDQQSAVKSAADATRQHVIDGIVPDADQGKAYCADVGGKVALADKAGLAAFASALEPITAGIELETVSKDLIAQIRALPVSAPSAAIAAC
jgi:TRAP-type C4-dicarboxylate transport system substrate-binding protein